METKNEEDNICNDFVDSSLFFEKDPSSPVEKKSPEVEFIDKSIVKTARRINDDDSLIIKADKNDSRNYSKWLIFLVGLFVVMILAGGAYWLFNNKKNKSIVVTPTEEAAEKITDLSQENSPKEETIKEEVTQENLIKINPLDVKISVLNGSGVAGAAGKIKDFLVSKKYENVKTGNYSSEKESGLIIYYKEEIFKENSQQLKDVLKDENSEIQLKLASTEEEKVNDVVIVVGK